MPDISAHRLAVEVANRKPDLKRYAPVVLLERKLRRLLTGHMMLGSALTRA